MPLGVGLAALSLADEPPVAPYDSESEGADLPDEESRAAAVIVGVEQSSVETLAATDEADTDDPSLPVAGRIVGSQGADATAADPTDSRRGTYPVAGPQDAVSAATTVDSVDNSGAAAPECPIRESEAESRELPAALRDPAARPASAMALGLSRRRSSMMIAAPLPAAVR